MKVVNPGTYECQNPECGEVRPDAETATLWFRSEFGLTTARACRTQECARAAVAHLEEARGWKLRPDNLPPMDRETRLALLAEREKEKAA